MTIARMNGRDRRALTIGVSAIAILLLVGRGLPVIAQWEREARSRAAAQREMLERAISAVALSSRVRDSAHARGARIVALAPALLGGDTPGSASATLAGIISGAAALSNVRVGALQLHVDTASRGTFVRVGVHGELTGDIAGITAMLSALESGPTLLVMRELSITQPEPAGPPDRAEALHIEMTVEGLMLRQHARDAR